MLRLAFTDDGEVLISTGEDASVAVWAMATVVALGGGMTAPTPRYTWREHALPVTDIAMGAGGALGWVATVSLDQTCKVCPGRRRRPVRA